MTAITRKTALILAAILTSASVISCGGETPAGGDETSGGDTTTAADETTAKPEYIFPELDCNEEEFTILNTRACWNMNTKIDFETQTGVALDDKIYNRNREIEELFNVKLNVIEVGIDETANTINTAVMADEDTYDAAYCKGDSIAPLVTEGMLTDLSKVPELQLDKHWWNQNVVKNASVGKDGALYYAISDLSLTAFDLTWCLTFNNRMMTDLGLDAPYDLVREGKWTIDKFNEYTKQGMNLNGDESFLPKADGNAVYGFTTYYNYGGAAINGARCFFTKPDSDNTPTLALENERFYNFAEKYTQITSTEGQYLDANNGDIHYEKFFQAGRAFFAGVEMKATITFREMEDDYGILPAPKYDENQEEYYSHTNFLTMLLTIPVTNEDTSRAGIILDALSYLSTRDVVPIYYDMTLSQKALRDEDSIDMLNIIRDSRYYEPSISYGWTRSMYSSLINSLSQGKSEVASIIASGKDLVATKIAAALEAMQD